MDTVKFLADKYFLNLKHPNPIEIPNMGRDDLGELFAELGFTTGVEIGTFDGVYAETLCRANPKLKLYCVDPWKAYPDYKPIESQIEFDKYYAVAKARLLPYNCEIIRDFSEKAAKKFEPKSVDFVYIDGNHKFKYIFNDLNLWSQKVRPGGIIAGHDYFNPKTQPPFRQTEVVEAVDKFVKDHKVKPLFVVGIRKIIPGMVRDKRRSFMWVKS
jgi:hypothetical protein